MSWELMSYGELMSGGTNVLDSLESDDDTFNLIHNNFVPLRGQVFAGQSVAQSRQIV